jgi:Ca2+-binding EF-hand superfamily protein
MSWMPHADRVAQLGSGVRCNKTVAKIALPKLRTSSQVNYPESAARPHLVPTFGGPALPAIQRSNQWDVTPGEERRRQLQLEPGEIKKEIVDSFDGTHSGLYSDWQRTSPNARKTLRTMRQERIKERSTHKRRHRRSPTKQRGSRRPENRHDLNHSRREAEARQYAADTERHDVVMLSRTVLSKRAFAKLQEETNFGVQELKNIMSAFQRHADHDPSTRSVNGAHFSEVIRELFDHITPDLCDELFESMDEDGSGTIDYTELAKGCAKLLHDVSTDDKFRMIFEAYDHDHSGVIDETDLLRIVSEKGQVLSESLDMVKAMMNTLDRSGDGVVQLDEFVAACKEKPLLENAFENLLPSPALMKKHVPSLNKIPPGCPFDWNRLMDLGTFIRQRTKHGSTQELRRSVFRSVMEDFFGFHDERLTGDLFDAMDADGSGTISFQELLSGLSTALRGTPEQRAKFFFRIYDEAGNGQIDANAIWRLVDKGHKRKSKLSGKAARKQMQQHDLLTNADTDGDGKISHAEFLTAVKDHPELLTIFEQCLH